MTSQHRTVWRFRLLHGMPLLADELAAAARFFLRCRSEPAGAAGTTAAGGTAGGTLWHT
jgi:hypothetical protein